MTTKDPFAERAARKREREEREERERRLPGQQTSSAGEPAVPSPHDGQVTTFAQGRPEKMLVLSDLPEPVDVPEATGDLSSEEEEILALCMQGVRQFETAWWVMGKALANINARRLYRKTHATFEDFARDVFNKSRPVAYEEMAAYPIGELMSARADTADRQAGRTSARADTIGKKAASALNTVTKDYGPEVAVAVHETIQDATGENVSVKELKGVIQQLPRKQERELTREELTALARELAAGSSRSDGVSTEDGQDQVSPTGELRAALAQLQAAHRALAPAKLRPVREAAPEETARLLAEAESVAGKIAHRARSGVA